MTFNAREHLMSLKGKEYLEVKWRIAWFRAEHPHGVISTSMIHFDPERALAVFKAEVVDAEGGQATGHGSETQRDFADYLEKAESKAIGRALAALGYGTQFAPDLEEGERIADAPVERRAPQQVNTPAQQAPSTAERSNPASAIPQATPEQRQSIAKLCGTLHKPVPAGDLNFNEAKAMIAELTAQYRAARQSKAS